MSRQTVIECTCDWENCRETWHVPEHLVGAIRLIEPTTGKEVDLCGTHHRQMNTLTPRDISLGELAGRLKPAVLGTPKPSRSA